MSRLFLVRKININGCERMRFSNNVQKLLLHIHAENVHEKSFQYFKTFPPAERYFVMGRVSL